MKRAVSSIDASSQAARGTATGNVGQSKLKRCKSAFANLKRLGGGGTSPSTPPRSARSHADGLGWGAADDLGGPLRWQRQCAVLPDMVGPAQGAASPSLASGLSGVGSLWLNPTWVEATAGTGAVATHQQHQYHQGFSPQQQQKQPHQHRQHHQGMGAERRLFASSSGNENAGERHGCSMKQCSGRGSSNFDRGYRLYNRYSNQEGPVIFAGSSGNIKTKNSIGSGGSGRMNRSSTSSRKCSFSTSFNFSPVPEGGEISNGASGGRCPFLRQQRQQMLLQDPEGQHTEEGPHADLHARQTTARCRADPGSPPAFSIVGFDEALEDDDAFELEGIHPAATTLASDGAHGTRAYGAAQITGSACAAEVEAAAAGTEWCTARRSGTIEPAAAVEPPPAGAAEPVALATEGHQKQPAAAGDAAAAAEAATAAAAAAAASFTTSAQGSGTGDTVSSALLLLRLQRRFEEMLLVSNVAT